MSAARLLPLRTLLAALAASLLAGCSSMRMAYDNADSFVRWKASTYLEVYGADSDELDDRIDQFMDWHRAKALPQYARLSEEAGRRLERGLTPEDMVWGYDSLVAQARESLRAAAERVAPLLDRVGPAQIEHIERGFAEDNRKFAKDYLRGSEHDRRKRRVKRVVSRLEDWVGSLSQQQLERVRRFAAAAPVVDELRDRDRRRLQAEFLAIVRAGEARRKLPDFAANWQRGRDPAYVAASDGFRKEFSALLLDLDRMLSAEQRARAATRFRSFAEDFSVLAARADKRLK